MALELECERLLARSHHWTAESSSHTGRHLLTKSNAAAALGISQLVIKPSKAIQCQSLLAYLEI